MAPRPADRGTELAVGLVSVRSPGGRVPGASPNPLPHDLAESAQENPEARPSLCSEQGKPLPAPLPGTQPLHCHVLERPLWGGPGS